MSPERGLWQERILVEFCNGSIVFILAHVRRFDERTDVDVLVVTPSTDEKVLTRWLGNRIDAGELARYRYDGSAAFLLGCFDETVGIVSVDEDGVLAGLIETSAAPIHEWSRQAFEELKHEATRPAVDDLSA